MQVQWNCIQLLRVSNGKKITINTSDGKISGIFQGIDNDGALKLKSRNGIKKIFVGDVVTE